MNRNLELNLKASWVSEIRRVAQVKRWAPAMIAAGWLHLGFFLVCQICIWRLPPPPPHWPFPVLWLAEVLTLCGVISAICGRDWTDGSSVGRVVVRVWATYLILALGVSTLNSLSGLDHSWFKLVWCTLGTFGFASMAWLFHLGFLAPAVQMYLTSLLMVKYPELNYLIHGLSWCLALNTIGLILWRRLDCRPLEREGSNVHVPATATISSQQASLPLGPLALALSPRRDFVLDR